MSSEDFLNNRILKKLDHEIQALIDKSGQDRKTLDEVFDRPTLLVLGKLISDGVINILDFPISTGKEANVFRAITPEKEYVALKIYRTQTLAFSNISKYIDGDPRFKQTRKNRREFVYEWAKKEYRNLLLLETAGINIPLPIKRINNVVVMDYIGDAEAPAPLLKDIKIDNPKKMYDIIEDYIFKMFHSAKIVHADLSIYNILVYKQKPYIIDLGQGVLLEHPSAQEFLRRDIHNIVSYFNKFNLKIDEDKVYKKITGKVD